MRLHRSPIQASLQCAEPLRSSSVITKRQDGVDGALVVKNVMQNRWFSGLHSGRCGHLSPLCFFSLFFTVEEMHVNESKEPVKIWGVCSLV